MPNPGAESLITDASGGRPGVAISIEGPPGPVGPSGLSDLAAFLEPGEALSVDESGAPVGVDAATVGDVGEVSVAVEAAADAAAAAQAKADAAATPAQVASAVAPKADKTYVDTALSSVASKTEVAAKASVVAPGGTPAGVGAELVMKTVNGVVELDAILFNGVEV